MVCLQETKCDTHNIPAPAKPEGFYAVMSNLIVILFIFIFSVIPYFIVVLCGHVHRNNALVALLIMLT